MCMKEKAEREREQKSEVRTASLEREVRALDCANPNDMLHLHTKNQCKLNRYRRG